MRRWEEAESNRTFPRLRLRNDRSKENAVPRCSIPSQNTGVQCPCGPSAQSGSPRVAPGSRSPVARTARWGCRSRRPRGGRPGVRATPGLALPSREMGQGGNVTRGPDGVEGAASGSPAHRGRGGSDSGRLRRAEIKAPLLPPSLPFSLVTFFFFFLPLPRLPSKVAAAAAAPEQPQSRTPP